MNGLNEMDGWMDVQADTLLVGWVHELIIEETPKNISKSNQQKLNGRPSCHKAVCAAGLQIAMHNAAACNYI